MESPRTLLTDSCKRTFFVTQRHNDLDKIIRFMSKSSLEINYLFVQIGLITRRNLLSYFDESELSFMDCGKMFFRFMLHSHKRSLTAYLQTTREPNSRANSQLV